MAEACDVAVIGSGTGGYVAAIRAAQLGLKVRVIERAPVLGGTCLNWGCIPTKALLEHAHTLKVVQHAQDWGVRIDGAAARIDLARVHARKDQIVSASHRGVEYLFRKNGIERLTGSGRLLGDGRIEVTGVERRQVVAREIIVATGSTPRPVPGIAIDRRHIITSDEALNLPEVPASMAVLGSGAVGVEFASMFHRFGSRVTLIEMLPSIVPAEDEAVSAELRKSFRKQGIAIHTGAEVTAARAGSQGVTLEATLSDGTSETVQVDCLLVATGRAPVTSGLGAEAVGLRLDRGYIRVDAEYRTSVSGISAVGDVITFEQPGHPLLAHLSSAEGIAVAERLAGLAPRPLNYDHVPACTYCDPEIGRVGLTEKEARARGYEVRTGTFPFGVLGRARIAGETEGFVKIVAETRHDELLGVHIIGPRATELVAEATVALRMEATVEELMRTIHAHPTLSEAIGEAAHATHGAALHL